MSHNAIHSPLYRNKQNDQQLELSELHSKIDGTVVACMGELKDTENHTTQDFSTLTCILLPAIHLVR